MCYQKGGVYGVIKKGDVHGQYSLASVLVELISKNPWIKKQLVGRTGIDRGGRCAEPQISELVGRIDLEGSALSAKFPLAMISF